MSLSHPLWITVAIVVVVVAIVILARRSRRRRSGATSAAPLPPSGKDAALPSPPRSPSASAPQLSRLSAQPSPPSALRPPRPDSTSPEIATRAHLKAPEAPRPLRLPIEPSRATRKIDDDVQFTAYPPLVVRPNNWYRLLVFAHKSIPFVDGTGRVVDAKTQVERQADAMLGEQRQDFTQLRPESASKR
jgi:hypothetical protein